MGVTLPQSQMHKSTSFFAVWITAHKPPNAKAQRPTEVGEARCRESELSAGLDEAATRRKCGRNGAERFTLSAAPDLACGRILINRCDLAGERGLHIDRESWLE